MKKLTQTLSLLLCLAMLIGLAPIVMPQANAADITEGFTAVDTWDLSKAISSGNFRTNGTKDNGTVTISGAKTAHQYLFKMNNTANVDHTKDFLLTQTLNITSINAVEEDKILLTSTSNVACEYAFAIWICDTVSSSATAADGSGVYSAIYSTNGTDLKLRLLGFEGTQPAAYIHIKDAVYGKGENVVCGTGDGKIAMLLEQAICQDGYEGFLTLEPHLVLFDTLQSLEIEDAKDVIAENKAKDGAEGYTMQYTALKNILDKFL